MNQQQIDQSQLAKQHIEELNLPFVRNITIESYSVSNQPDIIHPILVVDVDSTMRQEDRPLIPLDQDNIRVIIQYTDILPSLPAEAEGEMEGDGNDEEGEEEGESDDDEEEDEDDDKDEDGEEKGEKKLMEEVYQLFLRGEEKDIDYQRIDSGSVDPSVVDKNLNDDAEERYFEDDDD
eukprot:TRINITY_DN6211_c0_g1_i2.p1 TRINITY_DN6211_c0_g1~~TRINITY_DN6211_c0_g1_i2.p1  ORF type:complete len:178 (+),score=72.55 TRINITY_DN6211_c0_g1_i2:39-572(+)